MREVRKKKNSNAAGKLWREPIVEDAGVICKKETTERLLKLPSMMMTRMMMISYIWILNCYLMFADKPHR